jgi:hypothetical protein
MAILDTKGYAENQFNFEDERGMSSYAVIKDWSVWWGKWGPEIQSRYGKVGWLLLLLDANEKLEGILMNWARILREKPEWDTSGWSEDEWSNPVWVSAKAKAWFQTSCPNMEDVPEFARFMFVAMNGLFGVLERLSREIHEIQSEGHLLINMTNVNTGGIDPQLVEND